MCHHAMRPLLRRKPVALLRTAACVTAASPATLAAFKLGHGAAGLLLLRLVPQG